MQSEGREKGFYLPHLSLESHFVVTSFTLSPEHFVAPSHLLLAEHLASASALLLFVHPVKATRAKPINELKINFFIYVS